MIIARIFPPQSNMYVEWKNLFTGWGDKMDAFGLMHLFSVWVLTASGIVLRLDLADRYVYWEYTNWQDGFLRLVLSSILFLFVLRPNFYWHPGVHKLEMEQIFQHGIIALLFLMIGAFTKDVSMDLIIGLSPYFIAFFGGLLIYQLPLEFEKMNGEWIVADWDQKVYHLSLSTILIFLSVGIGSWLDDPIISTAAMVATPFPFIALFWQNHHRHLQRARFYPIFILAMFLCVRMPWFLVPLTILFFLIRTVNYFRYGIVYPSFGVDFTENN